MMKVISVNVLLKAIGCIILLFVIIITRNIISVLNNLNNPEFKEPMIYIFIFQLIVAFYLVFCGIGILLFKNWACNMTIIFSYFWIVLNSATIINKLKLSYPLNRVFDSNFLFSLFCIIFVLTLSRKSVREIFTSRG